MWIKLWKCAPITMYMVAIASFSGINSALVQVVFILKKFILLFFIVTINRFYKDTKKIDRKNIYFFFVDLNKQLFIILPFTIKLIYFGKDVNFLLIKSFRIFVSNLTKIMNYSWICLWICPILHSSKKSK